MKKKFILFGLSCLLISFSSCSSKDSFETDYKVYEVQGKVRQIIYKNVENDAVNDATITFNKDGMLLSEKMRGRTFEYQYDGLYIHSLKAYYGDSLDLKRTYTYKGTLPVEIREYDNVGTYRKRVHYEYDEMGNRIKGVIFSPYNDTLFVWNYEFEKDKVMKEIRKNYQYGDGFEQVFEYSYDEDGELKSILSYEESILTCKTEYKTYHGVSLQTKVLNYWDGEVSDSTKMTYGFDEKGNWIFRRSVSNGRELRQERSILYYK